MAQSVTTYHYGSTPNWEVISKDPWKSLNFTQEETEALSTEVEEMSVLGMLIQEPLFLPAIPNLILPIHRINKPGISPKLAAWVISGRDSEPKTFRKMLQDYSCRHGGRKRRSHMTSYSISGCAGVTNGVVIPFQMKW